MEPAPGHNEYCLICSVPVNSAQAQTVLHSQSTDTDDDYEENLSTFTTCSQLLQIPPSVSSQWNFQVEPLPFCSGCSRKIERLKTLHEQLITIQNNVNQLLFSMKVRMLLTMERARGQSQLSSSSSARVDKFRKCTLQDWSPAVLVSLQDSNLARSGLLDGPAKHLHHESKTTTAIARMSKPGISPSEQNPVPDPDADDAPANKLVVQKIEIDDKFDADFLAPEISSHHEEGQYFQHFDEEEDSMELGSSPSLNSPVAEEEETEEDEKLHHQARSEPRTRRRRRKKSSKFSNSSNTSKPKLIPFDTSQPVRTVIDSMGRTMVGPIELLHDLTSNTWSCGECADGRSFCRKDAAHSHVKYAHLGYRRTIGPIPGVASRVRKDSKGRVFYLDTEIKEVEEEDGVGLLECGACGKRLRKRDAMKNHITGIHYLGLEFGARIPTEYFKSIAKSPATTSVVAGGEMEVDPQPASASPTKPKRFSKTKFQEYIRSRDESLRTTSIVKDKSSGRLSFMGHEMQVTPEKSYLCLTCGNLFKKRLNFTLHVKHVHLKMARPISRRREAQKASEPPPPAHIGLRTQTPDGRLYFEHMEILQLGGEGDDGAGALFGCGACGRSTYSSANHVVSHMRKWHMDKSRFPFKCPFPTCGKPFLYEYNYKEHLGVHDSKRNYVCDICGLALKSRQNLSEHRRRIHEKLTMYACDICQLKFYNKKDCRQHRNRHNSDKALPAELLPGRKYTGRNQPDPGVAAATTPDGTSMVMSGDAGPAGVQ